MSENLTEQYDGYAIYLPSLQDNYARFAARTNKEIGRKRGIPIKFRNQQLNFLNPKNGFWHCGYTLYSSGQFDKAQIRHPDIVKDRDRRSTVVVGDSGGYQLGTGKLKSRAERAELINLASDPASLVAQWSRTSFRERTLRWLERYTDYAMTLDMALWASHEAKNKRAEKSQFRNLSVDQLLQLSVDNLRYFSDHRGKESRSTKFLNVLQDIGNDTGEYWYQAVKDFDFEGWSLGGMTGELTSSVMWLRRLLDDKKLDNSEWVHVLMKSPPVYSIMYTAAQRALREVLGRDDFTISMDSSSPHQAAGIQSALVAPCNFTSEATTWKIKTEKFKQDIRVARGEIELNFPSFSPFYGRFSMSDLYAHDDDDSDRYTDTWSSNVITNHNIYMYHRTSIDACDLVFGDAKRDHSKVPEKYLEAVSLIEDIFCSEIVSGKIKKLRFLMDA
jgi:hypothetical protein